MTRPDIAIARLQATGQYLKTQADTMEKAMLDSEAKKLRTDVWVIEEISKYILWLELQASVRKA